MAKQRIDRLNSLLKEVLSDVIRKHVRNPMINEFTTVTHVDISKDLRHAKVFISTFGNEKVKQQTIEALQSASGFIGVTAAKQVVMRFFPTLRFILDDTVDKQMRIEELLTKIHDEETARNPKCENPEDQQEDAAL